MIKWYLCLDRKLKSGRAGLMLMEGWEGVSVAGVSSCRAPPIGCAPNLQDASNSMSRL